MPTGPAARVSLSRQASWLAAGLGLLLAFALLVSWLTYDTEWISDAVDVLRNAVILAAWALLLVLIHRRSADAISHFTAVGACLADRHGGKLVLASCLAVTAVVVFTASVTLRSFPNSADEYVAVFQADTLAAGNLWNVPPPDDEAFKSQWTLIKEGKWVGQYPPGWSAALAGFKMFGVPAWAVNPIVGALSLLVFVAICRRLGSWPMTVAGVLLLGGNAFFIFNSASHFSHALVMLGGLLFVLFALRFQEQPNWRNGVAAGLALGVVGVTRHLEAVVFALPFFVSVAWFGPARHRLATVWIVIGGTPLLLALMAYYEPITGSPFLPTMQWGVPDDTLKFLAERPEAHATGRAALTVLIRIIEWSDWTSQPVLPLYFLALLYKVYRRELRFFDLYLLLFALGYFLYWGVGGNRYGPRYYYPALPFVLLTILTAAEHALNWRPLARRLRPLIPASLAAALALMVAYVPFWSLRINTIVDERLDLYRQVAEKGLENALVIIADATSPTRPMSTRDLIRNGIDLDGPVLYALDLGTRNAEIVARFPEREFWIYRRAEDAVAGELVPYDVSIER